MYEPGKLPVSDTDRLDTTSKLLLEAADYIEKYGWCQNRFEELTGPVCLIGAFFKCSYVDLDSQILENFRDRLGSFLNVNNVCKWNDTEGRTKEEVINALRACAYK